jgi:rhodanese-related sulfurtransferase
MVSSNLISNGHICSLLPSLVCIFGMLNTHPLLAAFDSPAAPGKSAPVKYRVSHPYCGLYCLYVVMRCAGHEVDFRKLVKPEYIGSRKGSSVAELKKAAEDNGLYAKSVNKLTFLALRDSAYPIVLHVKSSLGQKDYDHFELFLGEQNGRVRLVDPPQHYRWASFRELAGRWDGAGLIVSDEPIDLDIVFGSTRKRLFVYAAVTIGTILIIRWARRRWLPKIATTRRQRYWGFSLAEAAGLVIAALLGGLLYHFANDEGLLANAKATSAIQHAHQANFIPKVSRRKVDKLLNSDTVFIDARYARDFEAGHLEGAISVPVDANDLKRQKAMAQVARDARIVVYCQSAGCKFAEKVAIKLMEDGFSNMSIFKGGWREWAAKGDD